MLCQVHDMFPVYSERRTVIITSYCDKLLRKKNDSNMVFLHLFTPKRKIDCNVINHNIVCKAYTLI